MVKKIRIALGILISVITTLICSTVAGAYGEIDSSAAYYTINNGYVYDQYNSQVCSVSDMQWQSWISDLHTEVIRDTLTGAEIWEKGNCLSSTVVLNKWGQLICELEGLIEKDAFYEFSINDSVKTFKLTADTVQWLKKDLCKDLKTAIIEGFVPYTYNVYVPYTKELEQVSSLNLTICDTDFSYTMHPTVGIIDTLYLPESDSIRVLNLGGKYGITINDNYTSQISTLREKDVYVYREDLQSVGVTYVKEGVDKELKANAVIAARIPLKAPYTKAEINGAYVDMTKKTLVNNGKSMLLQSVGLDLSNFFTEKGFAYSNKFKEVITNGVNTLPTGDFLTISDVKEIGKLSGRKNPEYPVDYVLNTNNTVDIVVNSYGLCMIIPSSHINFEKLLKSLGEEEVIQALGTDNVKNGSVFELAKAIYQGLGGDKETWEKYMVEAGFKEPEGFNFGIIIFIVIFAGVVVGAFFIIKKVKQNIAERKEIENSYTNVLTGSTTKIEGADTPKEEKGKKTVGEKKKKGNEKVEDKKVDKKNKKTDKKVEEKKEEKVEEKVDVKIEDVKSTVEETANEGTEETEDKNEKTGET